MQCPDNASPVSTTGAVTRTAIRRKNGKTRVDTLRDAYGPRFAAGVRGDVKLSTVLQRTGARSVSGLLKKR